MPRYDYKCRECGNEFEEFHSMTSETKVKCSSCKSEECTKMISGGIGVKFNGTGFYETDYKNK
jgi:putative FmdB family regulatory protein